MVPSSARPCPATIAQVEPSRLTFLLSHDRSGSHFLGSFVRTLRTCHGETNLQRAYGRSRLNTIVLPAFCAASRQPATGLSASAAMDVISALLNFFSFIIVDAATAIIASTSSTVACTFRVAWWPIFRKPVPVRIRVHAPQGGHLRYNRAALWCVVSARSPDLLGCGTCIGDKPQADWYGGCDCELGSAFWTGHAAQTSRRMHSQRWLHGVKCWVPAKALDSSGGGCLPGGDFWHRAPISSWKPTASDPTRWIASLPQRCCQSASSAGERRPHQYLVPRLLRSAYGAGGAEMATDSDDVCFVIGRPLAGPQPQHQANPAFFDMGRCSAD